MSSLRILMYCNDDLGWEHTTRTLALSASLAKALDDCSILLLTDLSTIGKLKVPDRVDFVHLPRLVTDSNVSIAARGLRIDRDRTLKIRRKIAQSAIKTFRPKVVILDESLLTLPSEMQKIVSCIEDELPTTKIVWGLADTLGEPESVKRQWAKNGVLKTLDRFADEVLVFGTRELFDVTEAYDVPKKIAKKFRYTGYLARQTTPPQRVRLDVSRTDRTLPLVLLVAGGSSDNFALVDSYLRFLESGASEFALQSLIATGPAINSRRKSTFATRALKLPNLVFHRSSRHVLHYVRFADLVIYDGSYNITCEVLAHRKPAIVVPAARERAGCFHRARLLGERSLLTVLEPGEFHADTLNRLTSSMLFRGPSLIQKSQYEGISVDGMATLLNRIRALTGNPRSAQALVAS